MKFIIDDFSNGKSHEVEVAFAAMPLAMVEYFAARGDKDARAFLAAQKRAKPKRPA